MDSTERPEGAGSPIHVVCAAGVCVVDARQLVATARTQTGTHELGPDADAMHEALAVLVRSANAEAHLSEAGEAAFAGTILSLLTRRLEIEDWYRRHPEIDDQEIESVLFGLGLPRTGSTALSYLLAQDRTRVRCVSGKRTSRARPPTSPRRTSIRVSSRPSARWARCRTCRPS